MRLAEAEFDPSQWVENPEMPLPRDFHPGFDVKLKIVAGGVAEEERRRDDQRGGGGEAQHEKAIRAEQ